MTEFKTGIIIPDIHYPNHHQATLSIIEQLISEQKPDHIVFLGDCFDANDISRFRDKDLTETQGIHNTIDEINGFRNDVFLPLIAGASDDTKIHWCEGNHDGLRTREVIAKYPLERDRLGLKQNFPEVDKWCEYGDCLNIGKLFFTHGDYYNDNHPKKHVIEYGASIVYGHTHDIKAYTHITKAKKHPHKAQSLGCACDKNPEYIRHKSNNWQHAFGFCYWHPNGKFNFYTIEVIDKKAIFNGRIYCG